MLFAVTAALGAAGKLASGIMSAEARQAEFADMVRGLQMKKDYTVGLARSKAAASGVEMSSTSTVDYLAAMTSEFDRQIANVKRAASVTKTTDLINNILGGMSSAADFYKGMATDTKMLRDYKGAGSLGFGAKGGI